MLCVVRLPPNSLFCLHFSFSCSFRGEEARRLDEHFPSLCREVMGGRIRALCFFSRFLDDGYYKTRKPLRRNVLSYLCT